jgi:hypothetical protein
LRGCGQTKGVGYGEEEEAVIEIKGQVSLVCWWSKRLNIGSAASLFCSSIVTGFRETSANYSFRNSSGSFAKFAAIRRARAPLEQQKRRNSNERPRTT